MNFSKFRVLFSSIFWIFFLEIFPLSVSARPNPITSYTRLWAEWDVVPNTQWAPRSIDPSATQDRSLQIFKLQPVVPFRINDDWTVLTRTIFRFVSLPKADPVLGVSPAGLPAVVDFDQKNQAGLSDVSPTAFLVPNLGLTGQLGSVRRSSSLLVMARSIAERFQPDQLFWLFIIPAHGLLVLGCATSGPLPETQSAMTLILWWCEDCCVISSTAAGI